jgi:hypothetical protein
MAKVLLHLFMEGDNMRKCFMSDDDGNWFSVDVDRRGFFNELLDQSIENDDYEEFEEEFGGDQLDYHPSRYSFENLEEIHD